MIVRFVEEAQQEFLEAISDYEETRVGLGRRFKDEAHRCIVGIADRPEMYHLRSGGYRRINLRAFPYYIAYVVRDRTLWILAIAHGSRKPHYWMSRRDRTD